MKLSGKVILQIIPALEAGGAERTTIEMAGAIIEAGGQAIVISSGGPMVATLERLGARHIILPVASKNPIRIFLNARLLIKLSRAHNVDLLHVRSRAPAWSTLYAAKALRRPYIATYHGIYRAQSRLKRLYNSAMVRGSYVIANSDYTKEQVLAEYTPALIRDPAQIVAIHRGADLKVFDPDRVHADQTTRLRAQWGNGTALSILLPGRLTAWKGQAVLIEALHQLKDEYPKGTFRAILCGSAQGRSNYQAELEQLISDLGLTEMVKIVGHEENMPAAYLWADVTLSTSTRPEAFGRIAIEAQAMGCPVIASGHGGSMETVLPGQTGNLVPPADSEALAQALRDFEKLDAGQRRQMGEAARARARRDFSTEAMTRKTIGLYHSIL